MLMPQNNPEGYRNSSPRFAAHELHGALLLIHGSMDENVHMQNTLQFAHELQKAGKSFDMMIYPKSRHRLGGAALEKHRHMLMLDFVLEHLRPDATHQPRLPLAAARQRLVSGRAVFAARPSSACQTFAMVGETTPSPC